MSSKRMFKNMDERFIKSVIAEIPNKIIDAKSSGKKFLDVIGCYNGSLFNGTQQIIFEGFPMGDNNLDWILGDFKTSDGYYSINVYDSSNRKLGQITPEYFGEVLKGMGNLLDSYYIWSYGLSEIGDKKLKSVITAQALNYARKRNCNKIAEYFPEEKVYNELFWRLERLDEYLAGDFGDGIFYGIYAELKEIYDIHLLFRPIKLPYYMQEVNTKKYLLIIRICI